jgi:hypothetical protein
MKRLIKFKSLLMVMLVLIMMFGLVSCAGKSLSEKKVAINILQTYKAQYYSYYIKLGFVFNEEIREWEQKTYPTFTKEEVKVILQKKKMLQDMKPLINLYSADIANGIPPDMQTEQQLYDFIDKLLLLKL